MGYLEHFKKKIPFTITYVGRAKTRSNGVVISLPCLKEAMLEAQDDCKSCKHLHPEQGCMTNTCSFIAH